MVESWTAKHTISLAAKILINIACLIFVLYQAQKCVRKYEGTFQSVDVSIERASKHQYPELTFCPKGSQVVVQKLRRCNLTFNDYFYKNDWIGNCTNGQDAFEKTATVPKDFFEGVGIDSDDYPLNIDINHVNQHFDVIDTLRLGQCFSFNYPKDEDIPEITFMLKNDSFNVYVHTPGSFFGNDAQIIRINPGLTVKMTVSHEIFDVLDFDGEPCEYYEFGRDTCIDSAIHQKSMIEIGCTSPFGKNKSNVCNNTKDGLKAADLIHDLTFVNITEAKRLCPKNCKYQMMIFGAYKIDKSNEASTQSFLKIKFQRFIKLSKSRYSYTILELIAEFGGYVGLFLGLSINQLSKVFEKIIEIKCLTW